MIFEGGFRDSPEWGSTAVFLPFLYYQFYGDNSLIVEYYDVMKRYADYLSSTATDHIVSHGLGDWCDYREFFDKQTLQYGSGSQASNAMPLFAGIVEPRYKQAVLDNLMKDIEEKGYRLSTGDVGNRYLFQTLADNGLNEIMYKMHNHREVPGYGFQLQFGATTLTELWDPRAGASWNHFMMGQILEWFYKSLAGIRMDDKPVENHVQTIIIAPQVVGNLTFVSASHETLYGTVSVDWRVENDQFILEVSVPYNCQAKIYLPGEEIHEVVQSGSHTFQKKL